MLASQIAVAVDNARLVRELHDRAQAREAEAERMRRRFESHVTPRIAEQVFFDPRGQVLAGERRHVTVLVADVRGFTSLAEAAAAESVVRFLQEFFSMATHVVFKYEGTLDKFLGDGLMALYGAPLAHDARHGPSDPQRAVFAALDLRDAFCRLRDKWWRQDDAFGALELTVGVNSGQCLLGNMGSDKRIEYTAVGEAVNRAFRLCREAVPGQIRIGGRTYADVQEDVLVEPPAGAAASAGESSPADGPAHVLVGLKYFL